MQYLSQNKFVKLHYIHNAHDGAVLWCPKSFERETLMRDLNKSFHFRHILSIFMHGGSDMLKQSLRANKNTWVEIRALFLLYTGG